MRGETMAGEQSWTPAPENTHESLLHALQMFDGIEFDIRITADNQLMIHHDRTVSVPPSYLEGKPTWVEEWTHDELVDLGFLSFEAFLDDSTVQRLWRDEGRMGCIEIKRPHPKAKSGGGFFGRKEHNKHVAEAMRLAEEALDEREIPRENTVFYAFHRGMPASAQLSATKRPWAALIPYIPPYGTRQTQRLQVLPQFITTPFKRLVRQHRSQGSSMLPCAVEYFQSSTRHLPLGRHVGLKGAALNRLTRARKGMPTYVWPTKLWMEHDLLRAGMTGLTDHADPDLRWLPSGHARWLQPAIRPLMDTEWEQLETANQANHLDLLNTLEEETPTWAEADISRRRALVSEMRKRWHWDMDVDDLLKTYSGVTPPSYAPRLIGHRGSGKTSRPVLNLQSM